MSEKPHTNHCPIGIDMSGRLLTAVQLGRNKRERRIAAATSIQRTSWETPVDEEEVVRFSDVLERQGFQGRNVVLAMPTENLITAVLELPPRDSGAPLDQIARVELAAVHKCNPDSIESAYWELPATTRSREGVSAMAVGCRTDEATALLDLFESARLTVEGLDVKSWAVTRACAPVLSQISGLAAVLNIEWTTASLVVISDGVVVYERALKESGLSRLHESLLHELDLDADVADYILKEIGITSDDTKEKTRQELAGAARERIVGYVEAMVPEIRMSLGYAAQEYGQATVDRIMLLGEAAAIPGFVAFLGEELGLKTSTIAPSQLASCDRLPAATCGSPALTTAFGLAQYPDK